MDDLERDLHDLWNALSEEWQELSTVWRDPAADHYQNRYWEPRQNEMRIYLAAVDDLAEAMRQVNAIL